MNSHTPTPGLAPASRQHAFTLTELLVVIAILAILAAILIPVVNAVRAKAASTKCLSTLRQIGVAATLYSNDNKKRTLPPSFVWKIKPYYDANHDAGPEEVFRCPSDTRTDAQRKGTFGSYAYNAARIGMPPGVWDVSAIRVTDINNPGKTVYFSDARQYWMNTWQGNRNADFRHGGRINVLFFDCHVATLDVTPDEFYAKHL